MGIFIKNSYLLHPNVTRCDPYLFPFRFWFHPKYLDQVCLGQKSYQYWFWEMSNGCPWVTLYMCSKSAFLPRMLHQGLHPALLMAPSATAEENFKGLRLQCKNPLIFFFRNFYFTRSSSRGWGVNFVLTWTLNHWPKCTVI